MAYKVKSIRALIDCRAAMQENPGQKWDMQTWPPESWNLETFRHWFVTCLQEKINREDTRRTWRKMQREYQSELRRDSYLIKEHCSTRIRRAGCNLLSTPELKKRYPEIDTYSFDD